MTGTAPVTNCAIVESSPRRTHRQNSRRHRWRRHRRTFRRLAARQTRLPRLRAARNGGARRRERPLGRERNQRLPLAAHYVPVPGKKATLVRELFEELGVLRNGVWEERYLCFSPQERLYLHGRWQEGIEPVTAATARDREDFAAFRHPHERISRHGPIHHPHGARRHGP